MNLVRNRLFSIQGTLGSNSIKKFDVRIPGGIGVKNLNSNPLELVPDSGESAIQLLSFQVINLGNGDTDYNFLYPMMIFGGNNPLGSNLISDYMGITLSSPYTGGSVQPDLRFNLAGECCIGSIVSGGNRNGIPRGGLILANKANCTVGNHDIQVIGTYTTFAISR